MIAHGACFSDLAQRFVKLLCMVVVNVWNRMPADGMQACRAMRYEL